MKLETFSTKSTAYTLVLFVAQGETRPTKAKGKAAGSLRYFAPEKNIEEKLRFLHANGQFEGRFGETTLFREPGINNFHHLLVVGLGAEKKLTPEALRRAGALALRALKASKTKSALVFFPPNLPKATGKPHDAAQALSEGIGLARYTFSDEFKTEKKPKEMELVFAVASKGLERQFQLGWDHAQIVIECVNTARHMGDLPGNLMTPSVMAEQTKKAAQGTGLKVTVWDGARIKKEKMGCLLGVSRGSAEEPRLIIMEYFHGAKSAKPICFVGKGLTFDSGGISIKPSPQMEEMKFDMCGGAAVIGTMLAIARMKLKINAVGIVPATENMPGPTATKPGDIMFARNGKSVEVNNTDAEGRLILADALCLANDYKPQFIVDAATLTGAMVVALGDLHTGYFSNDDKLSKKIEAASAATGERVWRMPVVDEHGEDMKGVYADLANISTNKGAGSAHGAAFLQAFIPHDTPWAHFDVAGTAWNTGHRIPYNPGKGASGVMVRTFVELAKSWGKTKS